MVQWQGFRVSDSILSCGTFIVIFFSNKMINLKMLNYLVIYCECFLIYSSDRCYLGDEKLSWGRIDHPQNYSVQRFEYLVLIKKNYECYLLSMRYIYCAIF